MNNLYIVSLILVLLTGCSSNPIHSSSSPLPNNPNEIVLKPLQEYCTGVNYQWASCKINPVGSLISSSNKRSGNLDVLWSSNLGCCNGIAKGKGEARWCEKGTDCRSLNTYTISNYWLGTVIGEPINGQFQDSVVINTKLGRYSGSLTPSGGYNYGAMQKSEQKFLGKFNSDGAYLSGTLFENNKLYISDFYVNNKPVGNVMVGESDGTYTIQNCAFKNNIYECQIQEKGKSEAAGVIWKVLADIAVDKASDAARKRLESWLPILRRQPFIFAVEAAMFAVKNLVFS